MVVQLLVTSVIQSSKLRTLHRYIQKVSSLVFFGVLLIVNIELSFSQGIVHDIPEQSIEIRVIKSDSVSRGFFLLPTGYGYLAGGLVFEKGNGQLMLTGLDYQANLLWSRIHSSLGYDFCYSGTISPDKKFVLSGFSNTNSNGAFDAWIVKVDEKGEIIWQTSIGGKKNDRAYEIVGTKKGEYIFVGQTESWGSKGIDGMVVKIDNSGNPIWRKIIGNEKLDRLYSVVILSNGDLIISGITNENYPGNSDIQVIRMTTDGDLLWRKIYGSKKGDIAHSLCRLNNDTFLIIGYTAEYSFPQSNPMIMHLDGDGNVLGKYIYRTVQDVKLIDGYVTNQGQFIGAGFIRDNLESDWDVLTLKFDLNKQTFDVFKVRMPNDQEIYDIQPFDSNTSILIGHTVIDDNTNHLVMKWKYNIN